MAAVMYKTCPKCGYVRSAGEQAPADTCPHCGLIFSKWMKQRFSDPDRTPPEADHSVGDHLWRRLRDRLLYVHPAIDPLHWYAHVLLFSVFLLWGCYFLSLQLGSNQIGASFMHSVNLVFHEAGHVVFRPFGRFMTILGGSLGQLLMPLVVIVALIVKNRDNFGAALGLWWFSQSLMDLAPYINDARALRLQLLGGGTGADTPGRHDWHNILYDLGLLQQDHAIAAATDHLGALLMMVSFVWGVYILWLQYRRIQPVTGSPRRKR